MVRRPKLFACRFSRLDQMWFLTSSISSLVIRTQGWASVQWVRSVCIFICKHEGNIPNKTTIVNRQKCKHYSIIFYFSVSTGISLIVISIIEFLLDLVKDILYLFWEQDTRSVETTAEYCFHLSKLSTLTYLPNPRTI